MSSSRREFIFQNLREMGEMVSTKEFCRRLGIQGEESKRIQDALRDMTKPGPWVEQGLIKKHMGRYCLYGVSSVTSASSVESTSERDARIRQMLYLIPMDGNQWSLDALTRALNRNKVDIAPLEVARRLREMARTPHGYPGFLWSKPRSEDGRKYYARMSGEIMQPTNLYLNGQISMAGLQQKCRKAGFGPELLLYLLDRMGIQGICGHLVTGNTPPDQYLRGDITIGTLVQWGKNNKPKILPSQLLRMIDEGFVREVSA